MDNLDFDPLTIRVNNITYSNYYKNSKNRERMVAWDVGGSQLKNFMIVANHIKSGESILDYGCGLGDFIKYLDSIKIEVSKYLGVDINPDYIESAKKSYPTNEFKLIEKLNDINEPYDIVCAIGVFTWFITKKDFINTIDYLHSIANKKLILTCLHTENRIDINFIWNLKYRLYNQNFFERLFPDMDMDFEIYEKTMCVVFNK
jgi:cyclopropane fatty-acyl-phospholipid synthase-like methyltransferase